MQTSISSLQTDGVPSPRILLVGIDPPQSQACARQLMRAGAQVFATDDGTKAIEFFLTGVPIDLLLIDLALPYVDGQSVIQALRAAGCSFPIIGIATDDADAADNDCIHVGCNHLLTGPLSEQALLEEVSAALKLLAQE